MKLNISKKITPSCILKIFRWWVIGLIIVGATILSVIMPQVVYINENQILYYMSCLAQVIAALLALILAAYTIADTRLKSMATNDDTLQDYVPEIQNEYFRYIIRISVNCLMTIFLCFVMINTYDIWTQKLFSVLIVDTGVLGIISIIYLTIFVWAVCDPKAFQEKGEAIKEEIDQAYAGDMSTDDFRLFLGYYNRLEVLINKYAIAVLTDNSEYRYQRKQIPIFQALDILMSRGIFDEYVYAKIDEFRRYRNALVHSVNPESVNNKIYNELKDVYELLEKICSHDENDKKSYSLKLFNYCREHFVNELDRKIMDYLDIHHNAKLIDITRDMGVSKMSVTKSIKKLVQAGRVQKVISGKNGVCYDLIKS